MTGSGEGAASKTYRRSERSREISLRLCCAAFLFEREILDSDCELWSARRRFMGTSALPVSPVRRVKVLGGKGRGSPLQRLLQRSRSMPRKASAAIQEDQGVLRFGRAFRELEDRIRQ